MCRDDVRPGRLAAATAATLSFLVGVFFNNVSIAGNDYTVVVLIAIVAFTFTLLITALSWRCHGIAIRIWFAFIAVASILQLFDALSRRLPHLLS